LGDKEMTQEEKDLVLKDICSRLPYNVKAYVKNWSNIDRKYYEGVYDVKSAFPSLNEIHVQSKSGSVDVTLGYYDHEFKPYLFPMSSMTEEQKIEIKSLCDGTEIFDDGSWMSYISILGSFNFEINLDVVDWFNKNHFDYRGLIEKGLAIDATGLGIYE
jgi:hypothetical protein